MTGQALVVDGGATARLSTEIMKQTSEADYSSTPLVFCP